MPTEYRTPQYSHASFQSCSSSFMVTQQKNHCPQHLFAIVNITTSYHSSEMALGLSLALKLCKLAVSC